MTTSNHVGALNALKLATNWLFNIIPNQIDQVILEEKLSQGRPDLWKWEPERAKPILYTIADDPQELVQPKTPCVVLTYNGRNVNDKNIFYGYDFKLSYVTATPNSQKAGDTGLFDCALIDEAFQRACKKSIDGVNNIMYNGSEVSEILATPDNVPILARVLTLNISFDIEEDF